MNGPVKGSKTAQAKNTVKQQHLAEMTVEQRLMLPLYLHYRSLALVKEMKASREHRAHHKNT